MFGVLSFIPLFSQVVIGSSATGAGSVLTPMMLGTIVGSQIGARTVLKVGFRWLASVGLVIMTSGVIVLTTLGVGSSRWDTVPAMVLIGVGMGLSFISTTLAAQNAVGLERMGVATSLVNFSRQLGGALGVAAAASVMLTALTNRLTDAFPNRHIDAGSLLSPQAAAAFPDGARDVVQGAFADSLHLVFVVVAVVAAIGALTTVLMPRGKPTAYGMQGPGRTTEEAILPDGETFVIADPFDEGEPHAHMGTATAEESDRRPILHRQDRPGEPTEAADRGRYRVIVATTVARNPVSSRDATVTVT